MDTPRKFNFIDLYFDLSGEIEDKSTRKLYPQGNYQSVIYANFRTADPANVMGVQFELANGQTIDERPMYYIGKKINDGIEYHSWEFVLPDVIATTFRKDREVPLLIQFTEREISAFIGVFDEPADLPTSTAEEGDYAWVLSNEKVYGYVDTGDGTLEWEIQSSLETYGQVFGSDVINVTVAKALRIQRETVDIDTSELVLKALARTQADALKIDGNNATDDIDINGVTFNYNRNSDAIQGDEYDARVTSVNTSLNTLTTDKYDKTGGEITGNVTIDGTTTMNNTLDMTNHKIINVQELDAVNVLIGDLNIQDNLDLKLSRNGTLPMTGDLNMNGNNINNLASIDGVNVSGALSNVAGLVDGSVIAGRAKNTDDGEGNANTAQAIAQTVGHVNQDVKDTSTPEFQGVKLGDKTLTNEKLDDLDAAKTHADTTGNPHGTVAGDIEVDATGYIAPNEPLNTDADTIQKAFNQLYTHNHDQEYVKLSQLGIDSVDGENPVTGVATLGTDGKVTSTQLPSYVDDIVKFEFFDDLPEIGETDKIYIVYGDVDAKNTSYRWSGTDYFVFDQTTAQWGSISGEVTDQTDIENAKFTSTVSEGIITTTTLKESINELDAGLKSTNSAVSGNASAIGSNASAIGSNTTAISTNETDITRVKNATNTPELGDYRITFTPPTNSPLTSTTLEEAISEVQGHVDDVQGNVDDVDGKVDHVIDGTTDIDFDKRETNLLSTNIEDVIHEIYGQKGENFGIAPLDEDGRVPSQHLSINAIEFKGTFGSTDSSLNGDLPTTEVTRGDMYICDEDNYTSTVAGITFNTGDKAIYDGTNWVKNDAQDAVLSVNSKTGAVTLNATEIPVDASGFNGELVNTDNTVQKALERLDTHDHVEADITDLDKYTTEQVDAFLADKLDVGALASSIILYPTTAASDIANYNRLVTDPGDLNYNITAVDVETDPIDGVRVPAGQLIADANLFVGNPGIINVPIVGNIRRTSNNPNALAEFYFEIYKRDEAGNEELLAESDTTATVDSETYKEFNASALLNNGEFIETDRIVIKFFGDSVGTEGATYEFQFGGEKPVRALLNVPISATLQANRIAYNNTDSSLDADNLQTAIDELDNVLQSNITTIRVEQFEIVTSDNGDNTFTYKDANLQNQTGTIDAEGFYIFDLQVAGYYTNNNLAEININDDIHYYASDGDQFREGDGDSEGVATSVKIKHTFTVGDEVDIRYYQGLNIAASAVGDGAVSFGKLDAELQGEIQEVRDASSTNGNQNIVRRNENNEFQGILDGKFKTARTIALAGDVSGQAQFDGSSGITINTVVSKQNFDGGSAITDFSPEDIIIEGGGA